MEYHKELAEPIFGRVITAVVTPFNQDGEIDWAGVESLLYHLVTHDSDSVVVAGSTGEGATLSFNEKLELFRFWREKAPAEFKIIANTGTNDTRESVRLTEEATRLGVDGVMAVMPYYNRPNPEGQVRHFRLLAQATDKPVLLYNVPSRTGASMSLEAILELSGVRNIVGIKEASGDLDLVTAIARNAEAGFLIYAGDDVLTLPIMAVGGAGVVSVASHLVGGRIAEMVRAFAIGEIELARRIHLELYGLCKALFITTNPIPIKTALSLLGLIGDTLRLPLTSASEEVKRRLITVMNEHGLFPGLPVVGESVHPQGA